MFQSTPVIANGRIHVGRPGTAEVLRFNPRPLLLTGESRVFRQRPGGFAGFNPRPLLLTGESLQRSIVATPSPAFQSTPVIANGRIPAPPPQWPQSTSFNPRPLLLTGESPNAILQNRTRTRFNPRPLLLTGESWTNDKAQPWYHKFQSTPVIANGRIVFGIPDCLPASRVSIHARYC